MRHFEKLLLVGALACVGCTSTAPRHVYAEFALAMLNAKPLPAVVFDDASVSITAMADTLRLFQGGTGMRIHVTQVDEKSGAAPEVRRSTLEFNWRLVGEQFELMYVCRPQVDCFFRPNLTGEIQGNTLVAVDEQWPDATFTFTTRGFSPAP